MFKINKDIEELRNSWQGMTHEEKIDTFLWKMVWFHHDKYVPANPNQTIRDLIKTIEQASKSSESLTKSIRNATWVAAIVGGFGILVAMINLFVK